ncbi:energy-coupling factor transport system ATP-binding protein [Hydrogenoanaerobacterium saccharovorans]|uniref:Energy-coupling factor transport system ATP-binding protein n=1 Tax=Hydrogenoanaerobacterium saccharovorans TaxID=474960 RepID=A0A1H7Z9I3_9FIRM|nr:ABC transporter ATP-binding protein [Hydrogenoanaerobacterium saccharovorans]RPF48747.1 energy-coupling factor transport system ATP-binding protein [Hydrogenoanaerobacterium saccharovorans]SEM54925.1 energy-coupling factor transport system ATP-binding protein [Hydrogenoanaerobacterium saccharovorans]
MDLLTAVEVTQLCLSYGERDVFSDISFRVNFGDIIGISGKSGCGKSSLLHCLCGIIPRFIPANIKGTVKIMGCDLAQMSLAEISTKIGLVGQNPETQVFMPTVEDEIAFGLENMCIAPVEIEQRIDWALDCVGMNGHRKTKPALLSGGQKQLIALACALSMDASIFLFDEPLAFVDEEGRKKLLPIIKNLAQDGKVVIMVDHMSENLQICNSIIGLENGTAKEHFNDTYTARY